MKSFPFAQPTSRTRTGRPSGKGTNFRSFLKRRFFQEVAPVDFHLFSLVIRLAKLYNVTIDYIAGLTDEPAALSDKKGRSLK